MLTLNKLNKEIAVIYPNVKVVKGEGYFYLCSDDWRMGNLLAMAYTTSIYVPKINELSLSQWLLMYTE